MIVIPLKMFVEVKDSFSIPVGLAHLCDPFSRTPKTIL